MCKVSGGFRRLMQSSDMWNLVSKKLEKEVPGTVKPGFLRLVLGASL